jgi:hypothetical protein
MSTDATTSTTSTTSTTHTALPRFVFLDSIDVSIEQRVLQVDYPSILIVFIFLSVDHLFIFPCLYLLAGFLIQSDDGGRELHGLRGWVCMM